MANVYLSAGDNYTVANSATIFGSTGNESITIFDGVTGVDIDSSIETVNFSDDLSAYTFAQRGISLEVYKAGVLITTFDSPVMNPIFNGTAVDIGYSAGVMGLGSVALTDGATPISITGANSIASDAADKSNTNYILGSLLSNSNTFGVSTLDSNIHWDTDSQSITYSFNSSIPTSYYNNVPSLTDNWTALNTLQETAVRDVISGLNSIINKTVNEVSSGGSIQFNVIDMDSNTVGFAYLPETLIDYGGDIFLSSEFNTTPANFGLSSGEDGWLVIAHEIGHAMGLNHSFDEIILAPEFDDTNHTIMSYTNKDNQILNFSLTNNSISYNSSYINSSLYSLYDVQTLQSIYGANTNTNTQDNIYSTEYTDYKIQTIWDAGGIDTIDLSSTLGSSFINLNTSTDGTLNSADQYSFEEIVVLQQNLININFYNSWIEESLQILDTNSLLYTGKNNLGIAQDVIIENIYTGSGADTIIDNEVDNIISTYLGNDNIYLGNGGYDTVDGGGGFDTIFLDLIASQVNIEAQNDGSYILVADDFAINFTGIEAINFSDNNTLEIA